MKKVIDKAVLLLAAVVLFCFASATECAASADEYPYNENTVVDELSPENMESAGGVAGGANNDETEDIDEITPVDALANLTPPVKDETIFVLLSPTGSAESISVVNRLDVKDGHATDYGNYLSVTNLSDENGVSLKDGTVEYTDTSGVADTVFYEGVLDPEQCELPFLFDITYTLDGGEIEPESLAGASGRIGIYIAATRNENAESYFRDNMMLQISLTLDMLRCGNINAPGATTVLAGKTLNVAYTFISGNEQTFTTEFDAKEFSMDAIRMTAMKQSISLGDIGGGSESEVSVQEGISMLHDGTSQAAIGSSLIYFGMGQLASKLEAASETAKSQAENTGNEETRGLANDIASLLETQRQLTKTMLSLVNGIKQIDEGVGEFESMAGGIFSDSEEAAVVSFVAPERITPYSVQFIYQTPAIREIKVEYIEAPVEEKGVWERFIALFGGDEN